MAFEEQLGSFVRGVIDGSLSTLGVVIGASSGDQSLVIAAGMGGALANGVSNILGAFSQEEYKSYSQLSKIEKHLITRRLDDADQGKKARKQTIIAGLSDGGATIVGGSVPVIPFIFSDAWFSLLISIGLVISILFILGTVIGWMSKRNYIIYGLKLVILGLITAMIVYGGQMILMS